MPPIHSYLISEEITATAGATWETFDYAGGILICWDYAVNNRRDVYAFSGQGKIVKELLKDSTTFTVSMNNNKSFVFTKASGVNRIYIKGIVLYY